MNRMLSTAHLYGELRWGVRSRLHAPWTCFPRQVWMPGPAVGHALPLPLEPSSRQQTHPVLPAAAVSTLQVQRSRSVARSHGTKPTCSCRSAKQLTKGQTWNLSRSASASAAVGRLMEAFERSIMY